MLTDDYGTDKDDEELATKLVIFLPNPILPNFEQIWVYHLSNPAPPSHL